MEQAESLPNPKTENDAILADLRASAIGEYCTDFQAIGRGGFGLVFKCFHQVLQRPVAVKLLRLDMLNDENSRRLQREAKALGRIDHPNVVKVLASGVTPHGSLYLVLEYLDGVLLEDMILEQGAFSLERTRLILAQALAAVGALHAQGLLHRDIKPGNFMVVTEATGEDRLKLFDFGLVKLINTTKESQRLTGEGMVAGTAEYMSPEQCQGEPLTERSDIYALGCMLYQMYTGSTPFDSEDPLQCMMLHLSQQPKPLYIMKGDDVIYDELEAIAAKAMEKNPARRYQSTADFIESLALLQNCQPRSSAPKPVFERISSLLYCLIFGIGLAGLLAYLFFTADGRSLIGQGHETESAAPAQQSSIDLWRALRRAYYDRESIGESRQLWLKMGQMTRDVLAADDRDHRLSFSARSKANTMLAKCYRLTSDPRHNPFCREGLLRYQKQRHFLDVDAFYLMESMIRADESDVPLPDFLLPDFIAECKRTIGVSSTEKDQARLKAIEDALNGRGNLPKSRHWREPFSLDKE
jgi:serine/threonine protein kinase